MLSYGQNLSLSFRVDRRDTRLSAEDLVLEGAGMRVAVPLIAQGNAYPNENMQTYVFRCVAVDFLAWVNQYTSAHSQHTNKTVKRLMFSLPGVWNR